MYLVRNGYRHAENEADVTIDRTVSRSDQGTPERLVETWTIEGRILGTSQSDLTSKLQQLEAAYANDGGEIALIDNSGNKTVHELRSQDSLSKVRIVKPVSYPKSGAGEYAIWRTYRVVIEAEQRFGTATNAPTSFTESFQVTGRGEPITIWFYPPAGKPVKQVYGQTLYRLTQSGQLTGYSRNLPYPQPLFPGALAADPSVTFTRSRGDYDQWTIAWSYQFESADPLVF